MRALPCDRAEWRRVNGERSSNGTRLAVTPAALVTFGLSLIGLMLSVGTFAWTQVVELRDRMDALRDHIIAEGKDTDERRETLRNEVKAVVVDLRTRLDRLAEDQAAANSALEAQSRRLDELQRRLEARERRDAP